ncbi:hypothetical protein [Trinickia fusca]|uniref:Uncharacterized protein n=1 Tax=Trinickia fusca TaxID=2419777 RepID=A0A494XEJ3_9BURK|nr:hypothetical protein [Trinickia fusca]RKP46906.1 hypothetical protein D7S89_16270 [Trinickia fusca]
MKFPGTTASHLACHGDPIIDGEEDSQASADTARRASSDKPALRLDMAYRWLELCGWHADGRKLLERFDELVSLHGSLQKNAPTLELGRRRKGFTKAIQDLTRRPILSSAADREQALVRVDALIETGKKLSTELHAAPPAERAAASASSGIAFAASGEARQAQVYADAGLTPKPRQRRFAAVDHVPEIAPGVRREASALHPPRLPEEQERAIRNAIDAVLIGADERGKIDNAQQVQLGDAICQAIGGANKTHSRGGGHLGSFNAPVTIQQALRNIGRPMHQRVRESINAFLEERYPDQGFYL